MTMTKEERQARRDDMVRLFREGMAEHANDPDANEDAVLPEYVPLPVGPDEHLAIFVPKKSRRSAQVPGSEDESNGK
jgi:hypothetical protein